MDIKVIKTDEDYNAAVDYLEALGDSEGFQQNPELLQKFELVSTLVELYEKENFPLKPGHPLEIIKLKMDALGIQQKDLIPYIGSSGVVSEVFSKKRGLSKTMIRALSEFLHIDQNILNTPYKLDNKVIKTVPRKSVKTVFVFITSKNMGIDIFKQQVMETGMLFNINAVC